eukprot:2183278-Rhodomonas_salina.1
MPPPPLQSAVPPEYDVRMPLSASTRSCLVEVPGIDLPRTSTRQPMLPAPSPGRSSAPAPALRRRRRPLVQMQLWVDLTRCKGVWEERNEEDREEGECTCKYRTLRPTASLSLDHHHPAPAPHLRLLLQAPSWLSGSCQQYETPVSSCHPNTALPAPGNARSGGGRCPFSCQGAHCKRVGRDKKTWQGRGGRGREMRGGREKLQDWG